MIKAISENHSNKLTRTRVNSTMEGRDFNGLNIWNIQLIGQNLNYKFNFSFLTFKKNGQWLVNYQNKILNFNVTTKKEAIDRMIMIIEG